jgi:hypothetical protein
MTGFNHSNSFREGAAQIVSDRHSNLQEDGVSHGKQPQNLGAIPIEASRQGLKPLFLMGDNGAAEAATHKASRPTNHVD